MEQAHPIPQFKIILLGDKGVGKTTFISRFLPELKTQEQQIKVEGANIIPLLIQTSSGAIRLNVWDIQIMEEESQEFHGLKNQHYIGSKAAILMFDLTSRPSYKNVPKWYQDIKKNIQNIPVVIVGNKADVSQRKVKPRQITYHRKKNLRYYDISSLSNYQCQNPIFQILKCLISPWISLDEGIPRVPPSVIISPIVVQEMTTCWQQAMGSTINDDF